MDALELVVDEGQPANAGRFFHLGADLLTLLDELSDLPVAWRVTELRTGSAVAQFAAPDGVPEEGRFLRLVVDSLAEVVAGGPLPEDWTPDAVRVAHRFVQHGQATEEETGWRPPRLQVIADRGSSAAVDLTPSLADALSALQPFERDMPGSVRGTLVGLNVSRGNRASLRLATRRVVRVSFPTGMRESMRDALLRDVELVGVLRQDGDGRIFKVRAEDVSVLRPADATWASLYGIDPGYADGLPVDEWVDAGRGEA